MLQSQISFIKRIVFRQKNVYLAPKPKKIKMMQHLITIHHVSTAAILSNDKKHLYSLETGPRKNIVSPISTTAKTIMFLIAFFIAAGSAQAQTITDFRFTPAATGWEEDFVGNIDNVQHTITFTTQKWIENIAQLPATFTTEGDAEIKVGDTRQVSGVTMNDFRKDVVYTVGDVSYTVKFLSPQASGLPVIKINTENNAAITSKEIYTNMAFVLTDSNHSGNNISKTNMKDLVRGRGNDSWINPNAKKKSYRIKFDKKTSVFGLEAAKSWVLIAQYRDATLMYNVTAFELGKRLALPFNHSFNFVELYLNGEYAGNYLFTEQNQVGAGRVNINETEGWFVELDGYYDEEPKFRTTKYRLPVMIKSPEFEPVDISNPAYDFVRTELNTLTNAVGSPNFPENGYRDLINMDTFIDFLMINEICDNKEIETPMSTYMYKDKGGRISMGPLWDFDGGFGYDYRYNHYVPPMARTPFNDFFKRLFEDPVFLAKYKERWNSKYNDIASIPDFMDETASRIGKSAEQNFQTWWYRANAPWVDNHPAEPNDFLASVAKLKDYYKARIAYLNTEINKVETTTMVSVVSYSGIADKTPADIYQRSYIDFQKDMEYIARQGYEVISFDDLPDIRQGVKAAGNKALVLTFDKGTMNDFLLAVPVLKEYGFKATFFVIPEKVGTTGYMNWKELESLLQTTNNKGERLFSISSHSYSHRYPGYRDFTHDEILDDLQRSKKAIEENTSGECRFLALPYGIRPGDRIVETAAKAAGYTGIRNSRPKTFDVARGNMYDIGALFMNSYMIPQHITSFFDNPGYTPPAINPVDDVVADGFGEEITIDLSGILSTYYDTNDHIRLEVETDKPTLFQKIHIDYQAPSSEAKLKITPNLLSGNASITVKAYEDLGIYSSVTFAMAYQTITSAGQKYHKEITLFPNPANDYLSIGSVSESTPYRIYNQAGQIVWEGSGNRIGVASLPPGIYIIRMIIEGKTIQMKFVKQ